MYVTKSEGIFVFVRGSDGTLNPSQNISLDIQMFRKNRSEVGC